MDEAFRNLQRRNNDPAAQLLYKERMGLVSKTFIQAAAILGDPIAKELYPDMNTDPKDRLLKSFRCFEWVLTHGNLEEVKRLFKAIWFSEVEKHMNYLKEKYSDRHLQAFNRFQEFKNWLQTNETNARTMEASYDANCRYIEFLSALITEEDVVSRDAVSLFNDSVHWYYKMYSNSIRAGADYFDVVWGRGQETIDLGNSASCLLSCFQLNHSGPCNDYAASDAAYERCINLRLLEWFQGFLM